VLRNEIRNHVSGYIDVDKISENHLTHAIARAGMINTGHRVRDNHNRMQTIVIVQGSWTPESVAAAPRARLTLALETLLPERKEEE
jgi:hypothetical protein